MSQVLAQAPTAQKTAQAFTALRHRDYRKYYPASTVSMIGDNIEHVISYWVIYKQFHSPALAGFAVISHWLPFLLFSFYAGSLADRFDCRRLIQISQALYMFASLTWGLLFLMGTLQVWHAVLILCVHGIAGVVFQPADQLIIYDIVGREHLQSAIRLKASARSLAILLGPAVGGTMMLILGPAVGLLANVLIYLPMTVMMWILPYTGHAQGRFGTRGVSGLGFSQALKIFREVRHDHRIVTMIALGGAASLFIGQAFQSQMPEYAHHFGADDGGFRYSALLAANALGAILGTILLETTGYLRPRARTAIICCALWSLAMGLFPAAPSYGAGITLLVLAGIMNITFLSMAQTLVQLHAPVELRGRVIGLFNMSSLGLRVGSGMTIGVLGSFIGVDWSLELSAALLFMVTLGLLAYDRAAGRRLDTRIIQP